MMTSIASVDILASVQSTSYMSLKINTSMYCTRGNSPRGIEMAV